MIGFGVFLAVLGAILKYAFDLDVEGVDVDAAGQIMMVVGILLAAVGLVLLALDYFRPDDVDVYHEDEVVDDDFPRVPVRRRRYGRRRF